MTNSLHRDSRSGKPFRRAIRERKEVPEMVSPLKLALMEDGRPSWRVACEAGLTPTTLSRLTTGQRAPRPEEVRSLSRVLKRSAAELFPAVAAPQAA